MPQRCSWGRVMPMAFPAMGPSTVCACPASGEAGIAGHLAPPTPSRSVFGSYLWVRSGFEVVPATL